MTVQALKTISKTDVIGLAETLGQRFAANAAAADEDDCFVAENYKVLKVSGLIEVGVQR